LFSDAVVEATRHAARSIVSDASDLLHDRAVSYLARRGRDVRPRTHRE
jgi:hypothetical protein